MFKSHTLHETAKKMTTKLVKPDDRNYHPKCVGHNHQFPPFGNDFIPCACGKYTIEEAWKIAAGK